MNDDVQVQVMELIGALAGIAGILAILYSLTAGWWV